MPNTALGFFKELPKSFAQIGQVVPSSPMLARTLARPVRESIGSINVLEVGSGTGAVTKQILKALGPEDTLVVCEINRRLLDLLRKDLSDNRDFFRHRERIKFYRGPVQSLKRRGNYGSYDIIVSSLPFSNFDAETVYEILDLYRKLLKPNGVLTFYEYLGLRKLGALIKKPAERERMKAVDGVVKQWKKALRELGKVKTDVTLMNIPPALSFEVRFREK